MFSKVKVSLDILIIQRMFGVWADSIFNTVSADNCWELTVDELWASFEILRQGKHFCPEKLPRQKGKALGPT